MNEYKNVKIFQMGGTIDKCYPKSIAGYNFEIGSSYAENSFSKWLWTGQKSNLEFETVYQLDSMDITDSHRNYLFDTIARCENRHIMVTHGTDTLIETARFLLPLTHSNKRIVLTGSRLPGCFKDTDADFNLGFALGWLLSSDDLAVMISIGCQIFHPFNVERDIKTGAFIKTI